jgi:oxygen-independent coproporphyrinogen-3 oxidase
LMRGIYVHIPYCLSKCRYCAFNSVPARGGVPNGYVEALREDAARESSRWQGAEFASVYLGGGTPSLLTAGQLESLIQEIRRRFQISAEAEVTLECNPNTMAINLPGTYAGLGVNRISLGIQSLSAPELEVLGRQHNPADARKALRDVRSAGIEKVSADLIVGIPGQNRSSLAHSLAGVACLADHISLYVLSVEPGTPLARLVRRGAIRMPDESRVVDLHGRAGDLLTSWGFRRYEISNWCRPGFECRHNNLYWNRGEYVGLGAGSHSHRGGRRYAKAADPEAYIRLVSGGRDAVLMSEDLSPFQIFTEEVMLGLRTDRGVDPLRAATGLGINPLPVARLVADLCEGGYARRNGSRIVLSARGMMLHNAIAADIVAAAGGPIEVSAATANRRPLQ